MITPADFLEIMRSEEKPVFKIGTINPDYSGGNAKIKFDGEDVVSGKEYLSIGYTPVANDRVLLIKISGTYLILGKIGGAGGGGLINLDGGMANTEYGGIDGIHGGDALGS